MNSAAGRPPKRPELYQRGGSLRKATPIAHRKCAVKHTLLRATIQIAPTEFPKTRSAVESLTGVAARNKPTAYTSQEEEAQHRLNAQARIASRAAPKDLVNVVGKANYPQTPYGARSW